MLWAGAWVPTTNMAAELAVVVDVLADDDLENDFYPAVRTGSSNTRLFYYFPFFWWSLAPDLRFLLGQAYPSRLLLHRLERVS